MKALIGRKGHAVVKNSPHVKQLSMAFSKYVYGNNLFPISFRV